MLYLCSSLLSFLLVKLCPFFPSVSASGLLWGQRWQHNKASGRTHTQPWYTLYSINSKHFHTRTAYTHTQSPADRSNTTLRPETDPSSTSQCERMTDPHRLKNTPNYFLQVSSSLRCFPADPPTAQEAQREDDKLSIRPGLRGIFQLSSHTLWDPTRSSTCGEQRELSSGSVFVMDVWVVVFLSLFPLCRSSSENCNSPGKKGGKRLPGCLSGCNCSQRHDELVYKTTSKIAF